MDNKITKEEILNHWGYGSFLSDDPYHLIYLIDILNKEYDLDKAIEDIKSFRK